MHQRHHQKSIMKTTQQIRQYLTYFVWYGKKPIIYELTAFGCNIYPINSYPKKLDNRTQEGSLMGYTNSRATMKWWDPHTNKLRYRSSGKFDDHNNKFGKGWSLGSGLIIGTNTSTLKTLKCISQITP